MAIRYSGDTEIRLHWDARVRAYVGSVGDPYLRSPEVTVRPKRVPRNPTSSEAYDVAATKLLELVQRRAHAQGTRFQVESDGGRLRIRRVFQAPCPTSNDR